MPQQLTFPFLQQGDEADVIAHALTARIVNVVQSMASEGFRWTEGADLEIAHVREAIAADLRALLRDPAS